MLEQRPLTSDAEDLKLLSAGTTALHAADESLGGGIEARSLVDVILEIREAVLRVAVVSFLDGTAIARNAGEVGSVCSTGPSPF